LACAILPELPDYAATGPVATIITGNNGGYADDRSDTLQGLAAHSSVPIADCSEGEAS
jgi:hypothetical protein